MADNKKGGKKFSRNSNKDVDNDYKVRRIKKKVCQFCANEAYTVDYKEHDKVKRFVSEKGKILPRRVTGNCAKHQREVTQAVKRARAIALLPYTLD